MSKGSEKAMDMFLYWGSGSCPCWKAMIVLAEKGLWNNGAGIGHTRVEFSKKEHKAEDVMKLNPRGQVPTFKDGDVVVNESGAICMYIEEKFNSDDKVIKLMPTDVGKRAEVYQRMFEGENIRGQIIEPLVYYRWKTKKEDQDEELLKKKTEEAKAELDKWNAMLADKDYLCGCGFTMADVFLFPLFAFLIRCGATFSGHTNIKQYSHRSTRYIENSWHIEDSCQCLCTQNLRKKVMCSRLES